MNATTINGKNPRWFQWGQEFSNCSLVLIFFPEAGLHYKRVSWQGKELPGLFKGCVGQDSARLNCSLLQFTALLSKFSVSLLFGAWKLLNSVHNGQPCGIQICRRVHFMDIFCSIFLLILIANMFAMTHSPNRNQFTICLTDQSNVKEK